MAVPSWLQHVRAGEPFRMIDMEFLDAVFAAQAKVAAYPAAAAAGFEEMGVALAGIMGKVGRDVFVAPPFFVDVGFNIEIGDDTFLNTNATLLDTYPIKIGAGVLFGPNCALFAAGHPIRAADRFIKDADGKRIGQMTSGAPIVIEDEVWVGGNVVILQGVTIGARSMIGAGSVVTKSIPPDVLAVGNPARVIRSL